MPAASSADRASDPVRVRAAMILVGFVPLLHATLSVAPVALVLMGRPRWLLALSPLALYVLPALVVRLVTWVWPLPVGLIDLSSPMFLRWWFTAQCQVVFLRLPWLEELLRLVPALYSAWLRLWGSTIGALIGSSRWARSAVLRSGADQNLFQRRWAR